VIRFRFDFDIDVFQFNWIQNKTIACFDMFWKQILIFYMNIFQLGWMLNYKILLNCVKPYQWKIHAICYLYTFDENENEK